VARSEGLSDAHYKFKLFDGGVLECVRMWDDFSLFIIIIEQ
jgi:hypothetical protein